MMVCGFVRANFCLEQASTAIVCAADFVVDVFRSDVAALARTSIG